MRDIQLPNQLLERLLTAKNIVCSCASRIYAESNGKTIPPGMHYGVSGPEWPDGSKASWSSRFIKSRKRIVRHAPRCERNAAIYAVMNPICSDGTQRWYRAHLPEGVMGIGSYVRMRHPNDFMAGQVVDIGESVLVRDADGDYFRAFWQELALCTHPVLDISADAGETCQLCGWRLEHAKA